MFKQWKKRLAAMTGTLTLTAVLIGPGVAPAYADEVTDQNTYRIVTLGDSLTVGYEPGMDMNSKPYGFVDRLYEQGLFHGRTEVTNLGIGGLKTDGLKHYIQAVVDERAITAEEMEKPWKQALSIYVNQYNQNRVDYSSGLKEQIVADLNFLIERGERQFRLQ